MRRFIEQLNRLFLPPRLSRARLILALVVAVVADGLQLPLQVVPLAPEIIDVIAMVLEILLIGFHILLLPTFALEFIPVVDMIPTWTGCVIAVIVLRKADQPPVEPPLINVTPRPPPVIPANQLSAGESSPKPPPALPPTIDA